MWGVERKQYVTCSDGVRLAYEKFGASGPVVVLLHGWSGSRNYFDRNARALSKKFQVYAYDHRFHGESDSPKWGFHVARLAADLKEFLEKLELQEVTVVGASMGAAVLWAYIELFGEERLARAAFVDQAPLQWHTEEWKLGSTGCYDTESLVRLQCALKYQFHAVAQGNCAACLAVPLGKQAEQVLVEETLRCDPLALGKLMADHAQLDWRPLLPRVRIPCLNIIGAKSQVFPAEGVSAVTSLIKECHEITFENASHWLYLEEPDKFNAIISEFAAHGILGVKHTEVV